MITKHKPIRTCSGCRGKFQKISLLRLVADRLLDEVILDLLQSYQSRGVYICRNGGCLKKMIKNKTVQRVLKMDKLSVDIYNYIHTADTA